MIEEMNPNDYRIEKESIQSMINRGNFNPSLILYTIGYKGMFISSGYEDKISVFFDIKSDTHYVLSINTSADTVVLETFACGNKVGAFFSQSEGLASLASLNEFCFVEDYIKFIYG